MKFPHVCECSGVGFCEHLGVQTTIGLVVQCRGNERYRWHRSKRPREEWPESVKTVTPIDGRKFSLPVVAKAEPKLAGAIKRPVCVHRGELQHSCGCGDQERNIFYCGTGQAADLPEWSRCWNSPAIHDDADVGSCLRCIHYSDGTKSNGTMRRAELRDILRAEPPPVTETGRGVVQCVGGSLYTSLAVVSVHVLRASGCELPIEWWHLGRHEFDPAMEAVAANLGIRVVDGSKVARKHGIDPDLINGYELKSLALRYAGFREVLLLDADNIVVRDPTFLFDDPGYSHTGAIMWTDLPPADRAEWLPPLSWMSAGLPSLPHIPAVESGQFVVDRARCSRQLAIALHMNVWGSRFWYNKVFGDKDTFPIAWMSAKYFDRELGIHPDVMQFPPYVAMPAPRYKSPAIHQPCPDGLPLFEHCCSGKYDLIHGFNADRFTRADDVRNGAEFLKQVWSRKVWLAADETPAEKEMAAALVGKWLLTTHDNVTNKVTLLERGRIRDGRDDNNVRWTFRVLDNWPTLIIVGYAHKGSEVGLTFLRPSADGKWRGRRTAQGRQHITAELLT